MTRAFVCGEYRLYRGADGDTYAESVFGYDFWRRYLTVFDEVVVVARVAPASRAKGMLKVTGPRVQVQPLPQYVGFREFVRALPDLHSEIRRVVNGSDGVYILRAPGPISTIFARALRRRKLPYGAEVVGDPDGVFAPGAVRHPLRPLLRSRAKHDLRMVCRSAAAVAYVSRVGLPRKYPIGDTATAHFYSSATMPDEAYVDRPRIFRAPLSRLISVGSMDQRYKGFDVLLKAFQTVRGSVPDAHLTIVGGGAYLDAYRKMVYDMRLGEHVELTGPLGTPAEVRRRLDGADVYVSSSRTEGLPRVIIEAMARALPCVATDVGGTSELVDPDLLCPSDSADALAQRCLELMGNPEVAGARSARNLERSRRYRASQLQAERDSMYGVVAAATQLSLKRRLSS